MAQAVRDANRVTTLIAASNADGITPVNIYGDPFTHFMYVKTSVTSYAAKSIAQRDQNHVTTLLGTSASDGTTPVAIFGDPATNQLFVKYV